MKLPCSYKRSGWPSSLLMSVVSHAMLVLGASIAPSPAQYGVEAGLNSVEVMLVQEAPLPKPLEPPDERAMALAEDTVAEPAPSRPRTPPPEPRQAPRSLSTVPDHGAQQTARPDYRANPAPRYPRTARERGWEGVVLLRVFVKPDGTVGRLEVQQRSGHEVLDEAAMRTVRGWRFLPARIGGISLSSWVTVPVRFRLVEPHEQARGTIKRPTMWGDIPPSR